MVVEFASPSLILIPGCFEEAWRGSFGRLGFAANPQCAWYICDRIWEIVRVGT